MAAGILLVAAAVAGVVMPAAAEKSARENAREIVAQMREVIPPVKNGEDDGREDVRMPVLELNGEDFAGIIELPLYKAELPVCASWDKGDVKKYPCRYTGSVYDGSLVIGGVGGAGQFGFMENVTRGDEVYLTDTVGARFAYEVTEVTVYGELDADALAGDGDLVLFCTEKTGGGYVVAVCSRTFGGA